MRYLLAILALAGCDSDVPDDHCEPCIGEVPVECEDVCSPPDVE